MPKQKSTKDWLDQIQFDLQNNQSYLNLVLGGLIIIVIGVLLFNYFNRNDGSLGPSQQKTTQEDVSKDSLPGKYTVKEGDTLFEIAQKYYDDGYQYTKLVETNKLANENSIAAGQVLDIPKIEKTQAVTQSPTPTPNSSASPSASPSTPEEKPGTGGADNQTIWGEKITTNTYTVQEGDWLSKIAGRAYGDPILYDKIAKENNIPNPDLIQVGMTIKIPR